MSLRQGEYRPDQQGVRRDQGRVNQIRGESVHQRLRLGTDEDISSWIRLQERRDDEKSKQMREKKLIERERER